MWKPVVSVYVLSEWCPSQAKPVLCTTRTWLHDMKLYLYVNTEKQVENNIELANVRAVRLYFDVNEKTLKRDRYQTLIN